MTELTHHFLTSIDQCPAHLWDALAGTDYPFNRHAWLTALEHSGATTANTGWQPYHLLVEEGGTPALLIPSFIKAHSYGEYVFDWAWADAYQHQGLDYYPKLISAVPFTPCYGPRILGRWQEQHVLDYAITTMKRECERCELSGWHCLFPDSEQSTALDSANLARRTGTQFHWHNRHYRSFDDFVATFTSRKRKNVLKERRRVAEQGFTFKVLSGQALTEEHWRFFYPLYQRTYLKLSGHAGYLGQAFFTQLGTNMAEHCVMVIASQADKPVAASLMLKDSETLYGRYWGCLAEFDFLHFETCYYQGIDYAIAGGLQRFDGGAQGEHKLARGFEPIATVSHHWLRDQRFQAAVDDFLQQETAMVQGYYNDAKEHLPFKHEPA
ncbi:GNAT family N-acetyltransferase [Gilvimarinus agarilyticus]|uniref:GNAT family N-acetyltransferase n=1 Tax=unclassified Gilvimarinus TaxID=2642066 RepID=UPI001C0A38EE|nr:MULTISPECIES: GNAT family N-acetyltransferase [unclassified Gilvimarinus]MBU2886253.1 GNAT family N-acetyltransferase [Gilvimarinus agarilyticus]MDO6570941.1 GNAT family N-acetyltransferase [Gilvimarinus sp. 2_MG-2023]MDO6747772.1 GNAT family N-acetyltransferase [Gilvimarinus sp. 1_MG-2023]